jgi:hypothetical protein
MPVQLALRAARSAALTLSLSAGVSLSVLVVRAELPGTAEAQSSTAITPSLSPDLPNARGALTVTIHVAGARGVPSPVRRLVVGLPPGLSLDVPMLRSCAAATLRARGPSGCPRQSEIGRGHALLEAQAGSQMIGEEIALWVFLGPPRNLQPTFEVLGEGYTPLQERVVLDGQVIPDGAPFGEALAMDIPPIPTLPLEPDASLIAMSITVGASGNRPAHDANTVVVPASCPIGGFPFAAELTYADGSSGSALASVLCRQ